MLRFVVVPDVKHVGRSCHTVRYATAVARAIYTVLASVYNITTRYSYGTSTLYMYCTVLEARDLIIEGSAVVATYYTVPKYGGAHQR